MGGREGERREGCGWEGVGKAGGSIYYMSEKLSAVHSGKG